MAVKRAAVVGSGSAGSLHASSLRRRDPRMEIIVVRRPTSTQPLERMLALEVELVSSIDEAVALEPVVAVIAGPASTHRHDAEALASVGTHLLVEKPLATTSDEGRRLVASANFGGSRLVVGYHLRYSSTVPALAALVRNGAIGIPSSFSLRVGQHLSQWRPGADPRRSVTARQELGGGVLLELSHELDGLRFMLGDISSCSARLRRDGAPTDGLVDTVADLEIELASGIRGQVHLDMVSEVPFRTWTVTGSEGSLTADLLDGTITRLGSPNAGVGEVLHRSAPGERDLAEANLIDNFIEVAEGRGEPLCTGADGIAVLDVIEAALASEQERTSLA
ncbi:MAG: Gfo/Idh/MocA family oxidoreductase [Microthrixaceae bacterium]